MRDATRQSVMAQVFWYWVPVVLYAGTIFYLSAQSHPEEQLPSLLFEEGQRQSLAWGGIWHLGPPLLPCVSLGSRAGCRSAGGRAGDRDGLGLRHHG